MCQVSGINSLNFWQVYLEDGLSGRVHGYVVNKHGEFSSAGLFPFQMAELTFTMAEIFHGGDPNYTYESWDDPPSKSWLVNVPPPNVPPPEIRA